MNSTSGLNVKSVATGTELRLDRALEGVDSSFPPGVAQIVLGGVAYTPAELKKKIESIRASWKDARMAKATLGQFVRDKPRLEDEASVFHDELRGAMVAIHGPSSESLTAFGFTPRKPRRDLTVEEQ